MAYVNRSVQVVDVGGLANITCYVQGGPINDGVQWYHDGIPLHADYRHRMSPDRTMLVVTPVTRHDGGMYQCIITNNKNTAQAIVQLELGGMLPYFICELLVNLKIAQPD